MPRVRLDDVTICAQILGGGLDLVNWKYQRTRSEVRPPWEKIHWRSRLLRSRIECWGGEVGEVGIAGGASFVAPTVTDRECVRIGCLDDFEAAERPKTAIAAKPAYG